ncbi:MAG: hypothetical protein GY810_13120 [Aureispira sp.]|nr:hypothetical protein [Aureispira sp.]
MKNLLKVLSLVAVVAFTFACNKEKAAVNKLEGTWTQGTGSDDSGYDATTCSWYTAFDGTSVSTMEFTAYDVKDAEKGTVKMKSVVTPTGGTATTTESTMDYAVSEDGKTLTLSTTGFSQAYEIVTLTKSNVELKYTAAAADVTIDCDGNTENKAVTYTMTATK